jgi:copper oxidase (laccase) domain-containing protein
MPVYLSHNAIGANTEQIAKDLGLSASLLSQWPCQFLQRTSSCVAFSRGNAEVEFTVQEPLPHSLRVRSVHGAHIARVEASSGSSWETPTADGLFFAGTTKEAASLPPLAISTADCLALVFYAHVFADDKVILSVVHAGWRGYSAGMIDSFFRLFRLQMNCNPNLSFSDLHVVISPAVSGKHYECGDDVRQALRAHFQRYENPLAKSFHTLRQELSADDGFKVHPDLQLLAVLDLVQCGVPPEQITVVRESTYGHPLWPSHRQATHTGVGLGRRMFTHVRLVNPGRGVLPK